MHKHPSEATEVELRQPCACMQVLRTPASNPLSWQLSLLDSEVTQILQGRLSAAGGRGAAQAAAKHAFLRKVRPPHTLLTAHSSSR